MTRSDFRSSTLALEDLPGFRNLTKQSLLTSSNCEQTFRLSFRTRDIWVEKPDKKLKRLEL
jgi:hypothetical protein